MFNLHAAKGLMATKQGIIIGLSWSRSRDAGCWWCDEGLGRLRLRETSGVSFPLPDLEAAVGFNSNEAFNRNQSKKAIVVGTLD